MNTSMMSKLNTIKKNLKMGDLYFSLLAQPECKTMLSYVNHKWGDFFIAHIPTVYVGKVCYFITSPVFFSSKWKAAQKAAAARLRIRGKHLHIWASTSVFYNHAPSCVLWSNLFALKSGWNLSECPVFQDYWVKLVNFLAQEELRLRLKTACPIVHLLYTYNFKNSSLFVCFGLKLSFVCASSWVLLASISVAVSEQSCRVEGHVVASRIMSRSQMYCVQPALITAPFSSACGAHT